MSERVVQTLLRLSKYFWQDWRAIGGKPDILLWVYEIFLTERDLFVKE
jgi:hypothetical protein